MKTQEKIDKQLELPAVIHSTVY